MFTDHFATLTHQWLNNFNLPLALSRPSDKLNLFQNSFTQSGGYLGAFWFFFGAIILLAMALVIRQWYLNRHLVHDQKTRADHLFHNLLGNLDLTREEQQVLLEMSHGANLKFPVMSLLSPGLLRSSCDLWLKTRKQSKKKAGYKIEQLDRICWKVFGQRLSI